MEELGPAEPKSGHLTWGLTLFPVFRGAGLRVWELHRHESRTRDRAKPGPFGSHELLIHSISPRLCSLSLLSALKWTEHQGRCQVEGDLGY